MGFEWRGQGAFRAWLRTILAHRVRDYFRGQKYRPTATGDSDFMRKLDELAEGPCCAWPFPPTAASRCRAGRTTPSPSGGYPNRRLLPNRKTWLSLYTSVRPQR